MLIILLVAVACVASVRIAERLESTAVHGDESGWVASSIAASALLASANGNWRDWQGVGRQLWGSRWNPHLGQWLIGVPLPAALIDPPFDRYYRFDRSAEDNLREQRVPGAPLLRAARLNVAAVGVVLCVTAALAGWLFGGMAGSVVSAALVISTDLVMRVSSVALTDVHYNAFLLMMLGAALALRTRPDQWRRWCFALGLTAGLAASVKVSGFVFGLVFAVPLLLATSLASGAALGEGARRVSVFAASMLVSAWLLNPSWWPNWSEVQPSAVATEVAQWLEDASAADAVAPDPVRTEGEWREAFPQLANITRPLEPVFMMLRWRAHFERAQERWARAWRNNRALTLNQVLFVKHAAFPGEALFVALVVAWCGLRMWRRQSTMVEATVIWYLVASHVFIMLFMPVNWDRYYLPAALATKLAVALGAAMAVPVLYTWLSRLAGRSTHSPGKPPA